MYLEIVTPEASIFQGDVDAHDIAQEPINLTLETPGSIDFRSDVGNHKAFHEVKVNKAGEFISRTGIKNLRYNMDRKEDVVQEHSKPVQEQMVKDNAPKKHKQKVMNLITDYMENYKNYLPDLNKQVTKLNGDYFSCKGLLDVLH